MSTVKDYGTNKPKSDPTYSPRWSGKTAGQKAQGKRCYRCNGPVFRESGSNYCPACDDYVSAIG